MSSKTVQREIEERRLCALCHRRPARFRVRGGPVKRDDDHDMCFQCYRRVISQNQAGPEIRNSQSEIPSSPTHTDRFCWCGSTHMDYAKLTDRELFARVFRWPDKSTLQRDCIRVALALLLVLGWLFFLGAFDTQ